MVMNPREFMGVSPDGGLGSPKWGGLQILSYLILPYTSMLTPRNPGNIIAGASLWSYVAVASLV